MYITLFIDILGYLAFGLTLLGFFLNAKTKHISAVSVWLVADSLWVIYDIYIDNLPHILMAAGIIAMNLYAIYNLVLRDKFRKFTGDTSYTDEKETKLSENSTSSETID